MSELEKISRRFEEVFRKIIAIKICDAFSENLTKYSECSRICSEYREVIPQIFSKCYFLVVSYGYPCVSAAFINCGMEDSGGGRGSIGGWMIVRTLGMNWIRMIDPSLQVVLSSVLRNK